MGRAQWRWAVGLVTGALLLSGCTSSAEEPSAGDSTADASATPGDSSGGDSGGHGTVFVSDWDNDAGTLTIDAYPIQADGTLGRASTVLSEPAADTDFPGIVDGLGAVTVTGTFADYWTSAVQVYESGTVRDEFAADQWCGGEGLTYSACAVLDDQRLARTTELGNDPLTGEGPTEGSVLVSSLTDGATLAELGPFPDLNMMMGTGSADEVLLVTRPVDIEAQEGAPAQVLRLDVGDGSTTPVGTSPAGWAPLCPIGADSVLGFTTQEAPTAVVVGSSTIADIGWAEADSVVGCSADGRYLYLQRIPQPPTGENDTEPANPPTTLERITLSDGSRSDVLTLPPGQYAGPITR